MSAWFGPDPLWRRVSSENSGILGGRSLALPLGMPTLLDAYEVRPIGDGASMPPQRARMASIAIDIEWDEPPPSSVRGHGPRIWTSEE